MSKRKYFENKVVRGGYSREMPTLFFFHRSANGRGRKIKICSLDTDQGSISDIQDIKNHVVSQDYMRSYMNSRELGGKGSSSRLISKRPITKSGGVLFRGHVGEMVPFKMDLTNHVYHPRWQGMHQYQ
jgi:hypothetical protein